MRQQRFLPNIVLWHRMRHGQKGNVSLLLHPTINPSWSWLEYTCGSEGSGVERRDWRLIKAERIVRTGDH